MKLTALLVLSSATLCDESKASIPPADLHLSIPSSVISPVTTHAVTSPHSDSQTPVNHLPSSAITAGASIVRPQSSTPSSTAKPPPSTFLSRASSTDHVTAPSVSSSSTTTSTSSLFEEVNQLSPGTSQRRTLVNCKSGRKHKWAFLTSREEKCAQACLECRGELTEEAFADCIAFRDASGCKYEWISSFETYSSGCLERKSGQPTLVGTSYSYIPKKYVESATQIVLQPLYAHPLPDAWSNSTDLWGEVVMLKTDNNTLLDKAQICESLRTADWSLKSVVPLAFNTNDKRLEFDVTSYQGVLLDEVPNTVVFLTRTNATDNVKFIFPSGRFLIRRTEDYKYFEPTISMESSR